MSQVPNGKKRNLKSRGKEKSQHFFFKTANRWTSIKLRIMYGKDILHIPANPSKFGREMHLKVWVPLNKESIQLYFSIIKWPYKSSIFQTRYKSDCHFIYHALIEHTIHVNESQIFEHHFILTSTKIFHLLFFTIRISIFFP